MPGYAKVLPPHTYINVADFATVEQLADFLVALVDPRIRFQ